MKKIRKIWIFVFPIVGILSAVVALIIYKLAITYELFSVNVFGALAIWLIIFILAGVVILQQSRVQIPHMYEYIVEYFGEYIGKPLGPGLYFIFPWFDIFHIRSKVPMSKQMLSLSYNDKRTGSNSGDIEFVDCSASITAFFFFLVNDSEKATYEAANVQKFIEEKVEGVVRIFLGKLKIDEAIGKKSQFDLKAILFGVENSDPNKELVDFDLTSTAFHLTLDDWGITPMGLTISDIELPDNIKEQRGRNLIAEKDLEVARLNRQKAMVQKAIKIIEAEASKQARIKQGEGEKRYNLLQGGGLAEKVANLIEKGVPSAGIVSLITSEFKWKAVENSKSTDKTLILGGNESGGNVVAGAELGAGFSSINKQKN